MAASIRERLLHKARTANRPFNELLQYYAMERFLYRLGKSSHAGKFVLKGALMFRMWQAPLSRPTMDIDLLGRTGNTLDSMITIAKELCHLEVEPDGIIFNADSVQAERIAEDADYEGVRVKLRGRLDNARLVIQVDVGFSDVVIPAPKEMEYPTILDLPAPKLLMYNRETTIAEKFEAMTKLDLTNSRMKDFYDLWLLSQTFNFDGKTLSKAIRDTFARRETTIKSEPAALTSVFSENPTKKTQWQAFIRKNHLDNAPQELEDVISILAIFLGPITHDLASGQAFSKIWKAPGPWI
jgi:hypothetical protein